MNIRGNGDTAGGYLGSSVGSLIFANSGGVENMRIDTSGNVGIGGTSSGVKLDVAGNVQMNLPATTATFALCHATNGASTNDQTILDCGPTVGADYMEMYPTENEVQMGDLVIAGNNYITTQNGDRMVKLKKSTQAYQGNIIGIASDPSQANDFNSIGYNINEGDRPYPVALNGRVKVKVTDEGGSIAVGDYLTASSTSGKAMKANKASMVVGKALESWDPASGQDMIMVFVNITYYDPDIYNLATSDDLNLIIENTDGPVTTYSVLNNVTGDLVSKVGAFSESVIG